MLQYSNGIFIPTPRGRGESVKGLRNALKRKHAESIARSLAIMWVRSMAADVTLPLLASLMNWQEPRRVAKCRANVWRASSPSRSHQPAALVYILTEALA